MNETTNEPSTMDLAATEWAADVTAAFQLDGGGHAADPVVLLQPTNRYTPTTYLAMAAVVEHGGHEGDYLPFDIDHGQLALFVPMSAYGNHATLPAYFRGTRIASGWIGGFDRDCMHCEGTGKYLHIGGTCDACDGDGYTSHEPMAWAVYDPEHERALLGELRMGFDPSERSCGTCQLLFALYGEMDWRDLDTPDHYSPGASGDGRTDDADPAIDDATDEQLTYAAAVLDRLDDWYRRTDG